MHRCNPLNFLNAVIFTALALSGCTTAPDTIRQAHWQFLSGNPQAAADTLTSADEIPAKDKLLYLLEKGMYQHYARNYEASNKTLLQAADFIDNKDYVSLPDEAKELFANEWAGSYLGEYSERLWVHSILMMNFLQLAKYESAAVEARRALEEINTRPQVLEKDYFTHALIALSLEAAGQINDAYIVNRKLASRYKPAGITNLLVQQAETLGFTDDLRELQSGNAVPTNKTKSYAIVFIADGRVPSKYSGSLITDDATRIAFPQYVVPASKPEALQISVNGKACSACIIVHSDFGKLVNDSLTNRGNRLAAKTLVRTVFKDAVAEAVEKEDKFLGGITRILLFALEEADTRSWQSLPRHFTLVRVPLENPAFENQIELTRRNAAVTFSVNTNSVNTSAGRFHFHSTDTSGFNPIVTTY